MFESGKRTKGVDSSSRVGCKSLGILVRFGKHVGVGGCYLSFHAGEVTQDESGGGGVDVDLGAGCLMQ